MSDDQKEEVTLEKLPIHALRSALKEKGIEFKNTDKKVDLIKMLRAGETKHKPREIKRAPKLSDYKSEKSIPVVPKEIRSKLEEMTKSGLTWTIDEEECTITFKRDLETCANLDQSAHNILMTARDAYGKAKPNIYSDFD